MPNTGGYFSETLSNSTNNNNSNNSKILTNTQKTPQKSINNENPIDQTNAMEVDNEDNEVITNDQEINKDTLDTKQNENDNTTDDDGDDDDDDEDHFDERLVVDYDNHLKQEYDLVNDLILPYNDDVLPEVYLKPQDLNSLASTPKSSKGSSKQLINLLSAAKKTDGKILTNESTNDFQENANISPIYCGQITSTCPEEKPASNCIIQTSDNCSPLEMDTDDLDNEADLDDAQSELKRKRESFDSVSLMSVESFALPTSTKKPKLLRTGSITRSIKRSMSFVAVRTPIAKMLRPRRSSVALDSAPNDDNTEDNNDNADDSICSIASVETTFNESIRKPVKEKFRSLRNRITRSSSRKEKYTINVQQKSPEKDSVDSQNDREDFKTPKAPLKYTQSCSSAPRSLTRSLSSASKSSTTSTSKLCNKSLNLTLNDLPNLPNLSSTITSSSSSSSSNTCSTNLTACVNNVIKSVTTTTNPSCSFSTSTNISATTASNLPSSNQSQIQISNHHHQSNVVVNHNMLNVDNVCCPADNNIKELVAVATGVQTVFKFRFFIKFFVFFCINENKKFKTKFYENILKSKRNKTAYCDIFI